MGLSGFADSFAEWSYMTTKSAVAWKGHRTSPGAEPGTPDAWPLIQNFQHVCFFIRHAPGDRQA